MSESSSVTPVNMLSAEEVLGVSGGNALWHMVILVAIILTK